MMARPWSRWADGGLAEHRVGGSRFDRDGKPYSVDSVSAGGTAAGAFADRDVGTARA